MSSRSGFSDLFSSGSSRTGSTSHGSVSQGASGYSGPGSYARTTPYSRGQSGKFLADTRAFLESNSIVAKFAFLLLVLLAFIVVLRVGTYLIGLIFQPDQTPVLVDGMVDSRQMIVVPQNPNIKGSKSIMRSVNQGDGLEFTWSCWMWIDDLEYKAGQYKHVFHKGNDTIQQSGPTAGVSFPNNAPGLYIAPNTNELVVIMNTFNDITEEVTIKDIPIKKWICVMIRCTGRNLDVFINGVLTQRHVLDSVPKQNYGDVYVSMNGGFSGYTSSLQYFNYALGMAKIQSIVSKGPSLKMKAADLEKTMPRYLSSRWFFVGTEDAYNP